jgi:hypothetical protein
VGSRFFVVKIALPIAVRSGGHNRVAPGFDSAQNMHHGKARPVITSA